MSLNLKVNTLPKGVTYKGVCPHCKEELEVNFTKKQIKIMYRYAKAEKLKNRCNTNPSVNLPLKCQRCTKTVYITITKQELKHILKGFKLPIPLAQRHADLRQEKLLSVEAKEKGWL